MATITEELQKLHQGSPLVELYEIDLTTFSPGTIYRITPHFAEGGSVAFGGQTYLSMPIVSDAWEVTASGTQPRPTLTVTNVNKILLNAVISWGDLAGAKVTRYRTFAKFLDGEAEADPNKYLRPDVYQIEQKISHTDDAITFQLSSLLDKFGTRLPGRQILKKDFPGVGRQRGAY